MHKSKQRNQVQRDPLPSEQRQASRAPLPPDVTPAGTIEPKPLLRGRFHAGGAVAALAVTAGLLWQTRDDLPRFISMLVFGLSMIELYTCSAIYHIGHWPAKTRAVLRALDHANIFVLIAGTFTPICVNVLDGALRIVMLVLIWTLALAGVASAVFTVRLPRWGTSAMYLGMGWAAIFAMPRLSSVLPLEAFGLLVAGGVLYSIGAAIYALKRPNPAPRYFGFHEIFHIFVIAGSACFAAMVWIFVVPFPRS